MIGKRNLLEKQFSFKKARSTVDAIQMVVDSDIKTRRGTGKRKEFCPLISIDIRNAFNSVRWKTCIKAMMRKKGPDYLLQMVDDYLNNRWVIYEDDKWSLEEEMTSGVPEGSRVGPFMWNVIYNEFLRMDIPAGTSIIGFTDDALVVYAAADARISELRINVSLWQANVGWIAKAWKWHMKRPRLY